MSIEVVDKAHAELGPSGWHTWGNCPGSIALGEDLPNVSSRYAKEGTAAHALLEDCLTETRDAEDFLGREYDVEGEVFVVDEEMAGAVNSTVDIVRTLINVDEGDTLMVEQMVPLAFMTGEEGAEGTADIAGVSADGTLLTIADFKYGAGGQVYATDQDGRPNGQLAMYALGWLQLHGFMFEDIQRVKLVVIQPRKEWVDEFELSVDELRAFEDVVREAAGRVELNRQLKAQGETLELVPGEKQCKFCKAKGICPALREASTQALSIMAPSDVSDFEDLSVPKKAAALVVNEGVTNEKLAEFMRAIPLIEAAVSAAEGEVMRRLMEGQELPGFYLGVGRAGRRKWKNEETALKELTRSGRLKMSEAQAKKPISPTQAEKLLAKRPKVWAQVVELIDQSPGGPSVCKEGDKNPRYQLTSQPGEFENLEAADAALLEIMG